MPPRKKKVDAPSQADEGTHYAAELAYTMTPGDMSAAILRRRPAFAHLSLESLNAWIEVGGWDAKREAHFGSIKEQVRRKLSNELVQGKARQMQDLEGVWDQGMIMLEDDRLSPKNGWEGVVQAMLKVGECLDKTRARVMRDILREVRPEDAVPSADAGTLQLGGELNIDEARAAARAIVEARQRRLREMGSSTNVGR